MKLLFTSKQLSNFEFRKKLFQLYNLGLYEQTNGMLTNEWNADKKAWQSYRVAIAIHIMFAQKYL